MQFNVNSLSSLRPAPVALYLLGFKIITIISLRVDTFMLIPWVETFMVIPSSIPYQFMCLGKTLVMWVSGFDKFYVGLNTIVITFPGLKPLWLFPITYHISPSALVRSMSCETQYFDKFLLPLLPCQTRALVWPLSRESSSLTSSLFLNLNTSFPYQSLRLGKTLVTWVSDFGKFPLFVGLNTIENSFSFQGRTFMVNPFFILV